MKVIKSWHSGIFVKANIVSALLLIFSFTFSSCMMMGMHKSSKISDTDLKVKKETSSIDLMISEAIQDLVETTDIHMKIIAVWEIETQLPSVDAEYVRQKISNELVNRTNYKIVTRKHLDALLAEQSLSLSGTVDSTKAIRLGHLTGVEGFITGYVSRKGEKTKLSLNLIRTSSGEIIWSVVK